MCMNYSFVIFCGSNLTNAFHLQTLDQMIIFHDNACPHIATSTSTVFREYCWEVVNHPPYSHDLSPLDYNLFSKLKGPIWGGGIRFTDLSYMSSALA